MTISPHFASLLIFATPSPPVDTVRKALSSHSERMFFWLVASSIVTGIGVVFEAPGEFRQLKRWLKLKRLGKVMGWGAPITFVGLFLVIGGIIGEGVFEFLSADAETAIRAHDETVLGDTIIQAGTAKDSADRAKTAADGAVAASQAAVERADAAKASSGNAVKLASGARSEADTFKADIISAKTESADAVSRLAGAEKQLAESTQKEADAEAKLNAIKMPRSLTRPNQIIAVLKEFSGTEFVLNAFGDDEAVQFTRLISSTLTQAGWIRKQPTALVLNIPTLSVLFEGVTTENVPTCVETGISLHVTEKETLAVLNAKPLQSLPKQLRAVIALHSVLASTISPPDEKNVAVGIVDRQTGEEVPVRICVGKKP